MKDQVLHTSLTFPSAFYGILACLAIVEQLISVRWLQWGGGNAREVENKTNPTWYLGEWSNRTRWEFLSHRLQQDRKVSLLQTRLEGTSRIEMASIQLPWELSWSPPPLLCFLQLINESHLCKMGKQETESLQTKPKTNRKDDAQRFSVS